MPAKIRRGILTSSFSEKVSSWTRLAELIFFPSFCHLCSSLLELPGERVICRSCWKRIIPSSSPFCLCCGRFYEGEGDDHLCWDCLKNRPPFSCHRSCGRYRGILKDIILLFKYRRLQLLGKGLAHLIYRSLGEEEKIWWGAEALIPVPLHPRKKRQRGFNQAQVIAGELSKLKGIECVDDMLIKIKNVPPQTALDMEERKRNIRGAYGVKNSKKIKGKVVILVDDVFTTGSTVRECSSVLKTAGADEVRAITVAQA